MADKYITLLWDTKLKRPGCVILQARAGCSEHNEFLQMNFGDWLTHPTPDMKRITGTEEQWLRVAQTCAQEKVE